MRSPTNDRAVAAATHLPPSGLCCWSSGITLLLLSGILSKPWSPLASLPPDVEVPLPLLDGFIALPVVDDASGDAELAAGSPVTAPRPLAPPAWAKAAALEQSKIKATTADFMIFMAFLHAKFLHTVKPSSEDWFLLGSRGPCSSKIQERPEQYPVSGVAAL